MPLSTAKMAGKVNDLTFQFEGEDVNLTYRSGLITHEWEKKYKGVEDGIYQQIEELIVKWDIVDPKGKPLPATVAVAKTLPVEFLGAVIRACADDLVPNRKTSARSGGSSFAE